MLKYILKRLLLMIPTFLGTTFMVFVILSVVPGGPFEKAMMELQSRGGSGGEGGGGSGGGTAGSQKLSPEIVEQLKKQYGLDKPLPVRYLVWLGLYPRELKSKEIEVGKPFRENLRYVKHNGRTYEVQKWVRTVNDNGKIRIEESGVGTDFKFTDKYIELPNADQIADWYPNNQWKVSEEKASKEGKIRLAQNGFSGIFTGDFGMSYTYREPVLKLIKDRLHISLYFGVIGFILSYMICIPLGIFKAVKHGSKFDFLSSALVFMGYATPSYAFGALMLVLFGGGTFLDIFPLGGFHAPSEVWNNMSFFEKVLNQLHHTFLPVLSYAIGSFAVLTLLMKNSLMDNLGQDYVRTAFAKGLDEKIVIFRHAVRNSLIPIATGIGGIIGLFLAGSYLIELVFNIDGIGMLSFKAIINVDYPVFLGFLVLFILVRLVGNLISDLCYVLLDPRIKLD